MIKRLWIWFCNLLNSLFNKQAVVRDLLEPQPVSDNKDYESTGYVELSEVDHLTMEIEGCRLMLQDAEERGDTEMVGEYKQDLIRLVNQRREVQEQIHRGTGLYSTRERSDHHK